ncbi:MAG: prenyltransferase/squalene oxidase repeat-containing protein [Candidatus Acidiferrales bacterium]
MRDEQQVDDECVRLLVEGQLPERGWPFLSNGKQMAIEPTALALLALPSKFKQERAAAIRALVHAQNANGSWPAFCGDDAHGSGYTGLAVYALSRCREQEMATGGALHWLLQSRGRESHWLWKWKFRTTDRHVRFDPDKFGWPWAPEAVSWVVPTAYSLLALKCARGASEQKLREFRIRRGVEMMYDRMCPGGGWNAGNGVAYGVALAPHPDVTAIALLALLREPLNDSIIASLNWLEHRAESLFAPWSLAWTILALQAFRRPAQHLMDRLCAAVEPGEIRNCGTLAAICVALRSANDANVFGEDG